MSIKNALTERSKKRRKNVIGKALILCGVGLLLVVGITNIVNYNRGRKLVADFEDMYQMATGNDADATGSDESGSGINPHISITQEDITDYLAQGGVIGVLEIPVIGCKEPIKEEVFSYSLGHMPGTSPIGGDGNCCIAGHRNYPNGRYFKNLDLVKEGDEIVIRTLEGEYTYTITDSFVVTPDQVEVLDYYDGSTLTLITCTPVYIGTHRLIVRARLTSSVKY